MSTPEMGMGSLTKYDVLELPREVTIAELRGLLERFEPQHIVMLAMIIPALNSATMLLPVIVAKGRMFTGDNT